jgi:putative ABC transport system ATP-binding protein
MTEKNFLQLINVSKNYFDGTNNKRIILDKISAEFQEGQIITIVGNSGSGKSTLLNLISGIDSVSDGEIQINGISITKLSDFNLTEFRRNNIGFIFQFFNLIPSLTVWENVLLPLELKNCLERSDIQQAEHLLEEVGMIDRRNDFPDKLSGGEQQRVAIARAIVHNPDLILADEPTDNLDEKNGKIVMELLSRLVKENNKNLILVTHSHEAIKFANQVYSIIDGKLINFKDIEYR